MICTSPVRKRVLDSLKRKRKVIESNIYLDPAHKQKDLDYIDGEIKKIKGRKKDD